MPAIAVAAIQIGDQWDTLPATIAQTRADVKPKNVECSRNIVDGNTFGPEKKIARKNGR